MILLVAALVILVVVSALGIYFSNRPEPVDSPPTITEIEPPSPLPPKPGEILSNVQSRVFHPQGELLATLHTLGATSTEVVGALNQINGTKGVGFWKAYETFLENHA